MNLSKKTTLSVVAIVVLVVLVFVIGWLVLRVYKSSNSSAASVYIAGCGTIQNGTADVRDFGAKGDGSTDDTKAIQKAADCLSTALSENHSLAGTLYFPAGSYVISSGISFTQATSSWHSLTISGESLDISSIQQKTKGAGVFALTLGSQLPVVVSRLTLFANVPDAGAAIAMSVLSSSSAPTSLGTENNSSLTFEDSSIHGSKGSVAGFFDDGLKGSGLTNPIINNVDISGDQGKNAAYIGDACVSLTGGWGVTITGQSGCHEFTTALSITQKGGSVKGDARSFGSGGENGFVVNAGGGDVDFEGINNSSTLASFDISNASSVKIVNVMTLAGNRSNNSPEHYDIKIAASHNISIMNNIFASNSNATTLNSDSVYLAPGDQIATISGNVFDDPGTGVEIAPGTDAVQVVNNQFLATTHNIVGTPSITQLLTPPPSTQLPSNPVPPSFKGTSNTN